MTVSLMFVLPLLAAALWDLASYRIPNWLPLILVALFPVAAVLAPAPVAWGGHLAAGGLVLAAAAGLFALGWLGGGDVKLMAAAALWLGLANLPLFLLVVGVAGGAVTVAILTLRATPVRQAFAGIGLVPAVLQPRGGIPYGVAIAAGGLALVRSLPMLGG